MGNCAHEARKATHTASRLTDIRGEHNSNTCTDEKN